MFIDRIYNNQILTYKDIYTYICIYEYFIKYIKGQYRLCKVYLHPAPQCLHNMGRPVMTA